jgi:putative aldouronate transport system permease protein
MLKFKKSSENELQIKKKVNYIRFFKRNYQIYFLIFCAMIFFFVFSYIPMYGITMAFREFRFDKGLLFSPWIGFKYFQTFFNYFKFWDIIINSISINFFKLILAFPFPIIFALMITNLRDGLFKKTVQTVSYLPNFVSWVVVVSMMQIFLGLEDGVFNQIRASFGLEKIFFMNDPSYFYPLMFLSFIWKGIGMSSIIYIAALSGVDPTLYEAAQIDGANKFKQIWHISLPSILPTAAMLFILSIGHILSAGWDQIFLLRTPGNSNLSDILDTYILRVGLQEGQYGYATAVSLFSSLIGLLLVLLTNKIVKKTSEISLF